MNLRTFSAPTFAQAMALVKTEMGPNAVIMHTRTVPRRKWLGLRRKEIVEIVAGNGLNVAPRRRPTQTPTTQVKAAGGSPRPVAKTQTTAHPGRELLDTPAASRAMMMSISSEIRDLRSTLEDLVRRTKKDAAPLVP